MKSKTFNTIYGEVKFQFAMLDTDGTTLEEGVEVKVNDELVAELVGARMSEFEELTDEEVENLIVEKSWI